MMKKSTAVTLGLVLAAGISFACASGDDQEFMDTEADHQEICVDEQTGKRVEDRECDSGTSGYHWFYHGRAHGPAPAVGQPYNRLYGSTVRPGGTIARPPATGGFGTTKVSVGS